MTIDPTISEWLNLIFRWTHVFAGIMWVGTTYYFTWLDARLTEEVRVSATFSVCGTLIAPSCDAPGEGGGVAAGS